MSLYTTPRDYCFRLHHPRPRFKNDIEDVLGYVSFAVSDIGQAEPDTFSHLLEESLRGFKDNALRTPKTISNWRTEISALFALYIEEPKVTYSTVIAKELSEDLDLIKFFRRFVSYFQYPGGHLKPYEILKVVEKGIHFHPCRWLSSYLLYAADKKDNPPRINPAEFCHCVLNDLRVTRDNESMDETYNRIKTNRDRRATYDTSGDVIRYAKDLLDYMVLANLLRRWPDGYYGIRGDALDLLAALRDSRHYFKLYENCRTLEDVRRLRPEWFKYAVDVSTGFVPEDSPTASAHDVQSLITDDVLRRAGIRKGDIKVDAKKIGDMGEAMILVHEKLRIVHDGRPDLQHLIKIIPTHLAVGYDINSIVKDESKRCVEVKSSFSKSPLTFNRVHLTTNEWLTAEDIGARYFIYRLQIIEDNKSKLFLLSDPVGQYKRSKLKMIPRDGADIIFGDECGEYTELLK